MKFILNIWANLKDAEEDRRVSIHHREREEQEEQRTNLLGGHNVEQVVVVVIVVVALFLHLNSHGDAAGRSEQHDG